jgi:hypothetical protein
MLVREKDVTRGGTVSVLMESPNAGVTVSARRKHANKKAAGFMGMFLFKSRDVC